jgi:hypothetical protein
MFSLGVQAQTSPKYIEVPTAVVCAETPEVIKELQNKHKEYPVMIGTAESLLMVVWKQTQTGNFTITLSSLDGTMTCLLTAGTKLRTVTEKGL